MDKEDLKIRCNVIEQVFGLPVGTPSDKVLNGVSVEQIEHAMSIYKNEFISHLKSNGVTFTYHWGEIDWDSYDGYKDDYLTNQP